MFDTRALKAEIAKKGYTQGTFCKEIGMSQSTFSRRMKKGVVTTEEAKKMIKVLKIKKPETIFFA